MQVSNLGIASHVDAQHAPRHATKIYAFLALERNHQAFPQVFFLVLHNLGKGVLKQIVSPHRDATIARHNPLRWLRAKVDEFSSKVTFRLICIRV